MKLYKKHPVDTTLHLVKEVMTFDEAEEVFTSMIEDGSWSHDYEPWLIAGPREYSYDDGWTLVIA